MSMSRSHVLNTQAPGASAKRGPGQSGLLRILLIGPELRVEALRALLTWQEDMQVLSPISDYEHVNDIVWRISGREPLIDAVVMDWDGSYDANRQLLQALSAEGQRVLVISSRLYPSSMRKIEEAGAMGFCHTGASPIQLSNAIRKVALATRCFYLPDSASLPDLKVRRHPAFCQERLEARAQEIGWVLTETDIKIMSHFDRDKTDEIAEQVQRRPGTVRTDLSARIFLFLQLLSGRQRIPNKKVAYQVMLEFGIFEYR
jgi:DNA-binding NarL/FixJ family response regulator